MTLPLQGKELKKEFSGQERFLRAVRCLPNDHPPVWLMRQAGRALPEYRKLKERYSFLELVRTPELAIEVTLQPIRRFGFDAAILFSDILVIPEALGQGYFFRESGGVQMEWTIASRKDVDRLDVQGVLARLNYVKEALQGLKRELKSRTALLGFAGAPWTLANFMLEGGSSGKFTKALALYKSDQSTFVALMEKLTEAVGLYLEMQIAAGAETVQLFDSVANLIPKENYRELSGKWNEIILKRISGSAPTILFAKGNSDWEYQATTGATVLGIDHSADLAEVSTKVPGHIALQGNLDPELLATGTTDQVKLATRKILNKMISRPGHILNLGHGLTPAAKLENIAAMVETVRAH